MLGYSINTPWDICTKYQLQESLLNNLICLQNSLLNCFPGLLEAVAARRGPGRRRLLAPLRGQQILEPLARPGGLCLGDVPSSPSLSFSGVTGVVKT